MIYNHIGVLIILLLASITDIKHKIIPDMLLLAGLLVGILLFALNPLQPLITMLINITIIFTVLLLLYFLSKKAIGLGDVKLITLLGLYITLNEVFAVALIAVLLSGLFSATLLVLKKVKKDSTIPFAPFLLVSSVIVFYF
ncbi:A24 family peptidase [candidate division NPL-UPA2 bacterium]|nr:A24 family peptidase [candidate division NPL-UPA2 bacterium]